MKHLPASYLTPFTNNTYGTIFKWIVMGEWAGDRPSWENHDLEVGEGNPLNGERRAHRYQQARKVHDASPNEELKEVYDTFRPINIDLSSLLKKLYKS